MVRFLVLIILLGVPFSDEISKEGGVSKRNSSRIEYLWVSGGLGAWESDLATHFTLNVMNSDNIIYGTEIQVSTNDIICGEERSCGKTESVLKFNYGKYGNLNFALAFATIGLGLKDGKEIVLPVTLALYLGKYLGVGSSFGCDVGINTRCGLLLDIAVGKFN